MIIWKHETEVVARELRLSIDRALQTARDTLEKERGRLFAEGEREAYDLTWHCDDIESFLNLARSAFDALDEIASQLEPDAKHKMYCALSQFEAGMSTAAAITHGPIAHNGNEAFHRDMKRQAGLVRGENCKKQADDDWRTTALEHAKKIQDDDPTIKPGMLKKKIRSNLKNGKSFSDRQLGEAIRSWMKTGQLRHWKKKVQSPR